jgi:hypothetical protein
MDGRRDGWMERRTNTAGQTDTTDIIMLEIVKDVVVVFREAFHPSICPVIHPWMTSYPGRNKYNNPPPVSLSRKGMPGPRGGTPKILISILATNPWSAVCCYLTDYKQSKHQDFQRPGSRWIHAECAIERGFGNVVVIL